MAIWALFDFLYSLMYSQPFNGYLILALFLFAAVWSALILGNYLMNKSILDEVEKSKGNIDKINYCMVFLLALTMFSCKKEQSVKPEVPKPYIATCFDIRVAQNVVWKPIFLGSDYPYFDSTGDYYESGTLKGKYVLNCNVVSVSNPSVTLNNFEFKIKRLSPDTLEVYTARFGVTLFYR